MSKNKFALGTLIGATVGLIAGFLTAPKSGKETRADLKVKAGQVKADAASKTEYAANKAADFSNETKLRAQELVDKAKTEAIDLRQRSERAVEGAKKGFFEKSKK